MENNICIHQSSGFATHATTLEEKILTQKVENLILNTNILSSEHQTVSSEYQTASSEVNVLTSEHQTASS